MPESKRYLILEEHTKKPMGPFDVATLRELVEVRAVKPSSLIASPGDPNWVPLRDLPALHAALFGVPTEKPASASTTTTSSKADGGRPLEAQVLDDEETWTEPVDAEPALEDLVDPSVHKRAVKGPRRLRDYIVLLLGGSGLLSGFFLTFGGGAHAALLAMGVTAAYAVLLTLVMFFWVRKY